MTADQGIVSSFRTCALWRTCYLVAAALVLSGSGADNNKENALQDLKVAARIMGFLEIPVSGNVLLAIVFNPSDTASRAEATALADLGDKNLSAGDLTLRLCLVEQGRLATTAGYDAIFTTTGVDQKLLGASLGQRHVPCLTRHLEQVQHGACTVAINTDPVVRIVVNAANAAADNVRFATAFRMMVVEI